MKPCSHCREDKPYREFYIDRSKPTGRSAYCKVCSDARKTEWNHAHPLVVQQAARQYRRQNQVKINERAKQYYQTHKERWKKYAKTLLTP